MTVSDNALRELLTRARRIAVVGLSPRPQRPSHGVAAYLQAQGYRIIPVNPSHTEILGEPAYPDVRRIPETVDLVDVFRRPEHVPAVVEAAVDAGAAAVWLQPGADHGAAAQRAEAAGLMVVRERCLKVEHARLLGQG